MRLIVIVFLPEGFATAFLLLGIAKLFFDALKHTSMCKQVLEHQDHGAIRASKNANGASFSSEHQRTVFLLSIICEH